jgi:hypothetical protein
MKKYFIISILLMLACGAQSQNIGIGTATPYNKLEVRGNLLVNEPVILSATSPTVAQTKTMINGGAIVFPYTDSVMRLYDTGGPAANYGNNQMSTAEVSFGENIGFQFLVEDLELGTGDSLIIRNGADISSAYAIIFTNTSVPGNYSLDNHEASIVFKSNGDGNNGRGFSILIRRIYANTVPALPPTNFVGNYFYFDATKGALRVSGNPKDLIGYQSVAFGGASAVGYASFATGNSSANGIFSAAFGSSTANEYGSFAAGASTSSGGNSIGLGRAQARADGSIAIGKDAITIGINSFAIGNEITVFGKDAFALGNEVFVSGDNAIAIGNNVTANGNSSIALGNYVTTNSFEGCLTIGDNSTTTVMQTFVANGFRSRFAGGYRLFTNSAATVGAFLNANANSWAALSDVRLKENFLPVDGESFLRKIAAMPQFTWNYIGQDVKTLRHYGPMAQDFYAAFGNDGLGTIGCDTLINQQDFLGINLVAIQALEKRTRVLTEEINETKKALEYSRKQVALLEEQNKLLRESIHDESCRQHK